MGRVEPNDQDLPDEELILVVPRLAPPPRTRVRLTAALGVTVWLGLASRRWPLPGFLAEHAGDALYAVAAYWAIALARPAWPVAWLLLAAWGAAAAVEVSQLAHPPWLDAIRATRPGALLLGHGFKPEDLVAYAVGAALAGGLDAAGVMRERAIVGAPYDDIDDPEENPNVR